LGAKAKSPQMNLHKPMYGGVGEGGLQWSGGSTIEVEVELAGRCFCFVCEAIPETRDRN